MHCDIGIVTMCLAERKVACQLLGYGSMDDVSTLILTFTLTFTLTSYVFAFLLALSSIQYYGVWFCVLCCVVSIESRIAYCVMCYVVSWPHVLCSIELCYDCDVLCVVVSCVM